MQSKEIKRLISTGLTSRTIYRGHTSLLPVSAISNFYHLGAGNKFTLVSSQSGHQYQNIRLFSSSDNDKLKETLRKLKKEFDGKGNPSTTEENPESANSSDSSKTQDEQPTKSESTAADDNTSVFDNVKNFTTKSISFVRDNLKGAYDDMMGYSKGTNLERQLHQAESYRAPKKKSDDESEEDLETETPIYTGPSAIVHVKEPLSQWEQMKLRMENSPLIREILKNSKKIGQAAAGTDIGKAAFDTKNKINDKIEDIREVWETSQNPIIYTLSGVWDNMTGETDEAMAISAIRKLDPDFVKEEWLEEVRVELAPKIIKAHLTGELKTLKKWIGSESTFKKLAADIAARKQDGKFIDPTILNVDENQVIVKILEDGQPTILCVYMVQQINCIRDREGNICEGKADEIRARFYSLAFQQEYEETNSVVTWKIMDYQFVGDLPYAF